MEFTLSEEQTLFQDSVARFLEDDHRFEDRPKRMAEPHGYLTAHWQHFAEMGWLALPLPESAGGLGGSMIDTWMLMEQMGRGLVVSPYVPIVVGAGRLLADVGRGEAEQIAEGELKVALALGGAVQLSNQKLDGVVNVVEFAGDMDGFVVEARENTDPVLVYISAKANGLSIEAARTIDGGSAGQLTFSGVAIGEGDMIARGEAGSKTILAAQQRCNAALVAEASGLMWAAYETTLDYVKTRKQFGETLGSFQMVQHRLVDCYTKCQFATSAALDAAWAVDRAKPDAATHISGAKYLVGEYARAVLQEAIQLHGGMGVMREMPLGAYYARSIVIDSLFGDGRSHLKAVYQHLQES